MHIATFSLAVTIVLLKHIVYYVNDCLSYIINTGYIYVMHGDHNNNITIYILPVQYYVSYCSFWLTINDAISSEGPCDSQ